MPTGAINGYLLVTDALGNTFWQDPASAASNWTLTGNDLYPDNPTYNVGIGNTGPAYKLDITGDIRVADGYDIILGGEDLLGEQIGVRTYTDQRYVVDNDPLTTALDALDVALYDVSTGAAGLWRDQGNYYYPTNFTSFAVMDTGRLGIGTTAPGEELDVIGDIRASVDIYAGTDLYIGGTALSANTSTSSGAALVGLFDDSLTYISANTDVQGAIGELDTAIANISADSMPAGTLDGQTVRYSGGWIADSYLFNNSTNIGIGTTSPSSELAVVGDISLDGDDFWVGLSDTTERIIFDSDGDDIEMMGANVGIGTTAPAYELDVNGDIQADNIRALTDFYVGSVGLDDNAGVASGASLIGLYSDSYTYITADTDVQGGIAQLDAALVSLSGDTMPQGSLDGQTIRYSSGWIVDQNLFNDGTNVGIGETNPLYKLEVNGDIRVYPGFDVYIVLLVEEHIVKITT